MIIPIIEQSYTITMIKQVRYFSILIRYNERKRIVGSENLVSW